MELSFFLLFRIAEITGVEEKKFKLFQAELFKNLLKFNYQGRFELKEPGNSPV